MKDKVPFYEIVNMFFVGSVFTLLTLLLCFNSLPWDLVKDHLSLFSDWTFLISAVLLIAMYEIGFILNKAGSIIITPILSKTKIWPREEYHIDVSKIAKGNPKFQSMITELVLMRSHIMMFLVLAAIAFYNGKIIYAVTFIVLVVVFVLAGRMHNARINIIRKDYQKENEPQGDKHEARREREN